MGRGGLRWDLAGQSWCGGGYDQLPLGCDGLLRSSGIDSRVSPSQLGRLRTSGPDCSATVGAAEHKSIRWRSWKCTLFGESAGSIDATTLMTSPLTKNLFRRVIAESGPAFGLGPERTVAQMEPLGVAAGKEAGGQPGSQLAVLRKLPAGQITHIEDRLIGSQFKGYDPNASIVDGWVLPQPPQWPSLLERFSQSISWRDSMRESSARSALVLQRRQRSRPTRQQARSE